MIIRVALVLLMLVAPLLANERILSFHSDIVVEKSGDLLVTETIRVRAEGREIQRGIYRDIPQLQQTKWGLRKKKPFDVLGAKRDGKDEYYDVSSIGKGGLRIKIGKADVFLKPGDYTYEITYRTGMQLYFEEERDVLYWNVNGTEWGFVTDAVSARVVLPEGIEVSRVDGSTGKYGEEGTDFRAESEGKVATFASTRRFGSREGLTIVVEWPPGRLDPSAYEKADGSLWSEHPLVFLALLLMLASLGYDVGAWIAVGRDPKEGVIIPRYEPPKGFSPAAVRYLARMGFDNTCFSAGVVGLAVKGVATIEQEGSDYTIKNRWNDEQKEPLEGDEARLYEKLLGSSASIELKQRNHATIGGARTALQKALATKLEKTHFVRNLPWWLGGLLLSLLATLVLVLATGSSPVALFLLLWLSIWTVGTSALLSRGWLLWKGRNYAAAIGATLFAIPFLIGWVAGASFFAKEAGPWAASAFVFAGVVNTVFYHLIKAPTHLGRKVMDHIEGFRRYLSVAEEDRLNLQNPPERTPELFERFLPYALALDCEQKWSQQFDEVLRAAGTTPGEAGRTSYRPSFYTGTHTGMDRAMSAAALGGALTGALASSASAPSSSGGSGGGGGFSGGGGGGGGGGGW